MTLPESKRYKIDCSKLLETKNKNIYVTCYFINVVFASLDIKSFKIYVIREQKKKVNILSLYFSMSCLSIVGSVFVLTKLAM